MASSVAYPDLGAGGDPAYAPFFGFAGIFMAIVFSCKQAHQSNLSLLCFDDRSNATFFLFGFHVTYTEILNYSPCATRYILTLCDDVLLILTIWRNQTMVIKLYVCLSVEFNHVIRCWSRSRNCKSWSYHRIYRCLQAWANHESKLIYSSTRSASCQNK